MIPKQPHMPASAVSFLRSKLTADASYLEYGSGGSTHMAHSAGVRHLISVETDASWIAQIGRELAQRKSVSKTKLIHANIGPTTEWGYPASHQQWKNYRDYPLLPWEYCSENAITPGLILIDGRFRTACFLASLLHSKPGCVILFDDYLERTHHHNVETFLKPTARYDRLAMFETPHDIGDRNEIWRRFTLAVTDPR